MIRAQKFSRLVWVTGVLSEVTRWAKKLKVINRVESPKGQGHDVVNVELPKLSAAVVAQPRLVAQQGVYVVARERADCRGPKPSSAPNASRGPVFLSAKGIVGQPALAGGARLFRERASPGSRFLCQFFGVLEAVLLPVQQKFFAVCRVVGATRSDTPVFMHRAVDFFRFADSVFMLRVVNPFLRGYLVLMRRVVRPTCGVSRIFVFGVRDAVTLLEFSPMRGVRFSLVRAAGFWIFSFPSGSRKSLRSLLSFRERPTLALLRSRCYDFLTHLQPPKQVVELSRPLWVPAQVRPSLVSLPHFCSAVK